MLKKLRDLRKNESKGFTLIEIVLVLAIAGLILVIVFIAVQGAQRSRRDAARKSDAARLLAGVESCASNHNGQYASCQTQFDLITAPNTYFGGRSPLNTPNKIVPAATGDSQFQVVINQDCNGANTGHVAVRSYQEAGALFCVAN